MTSAVNIADILADHARTCPSHPAIEDGERIVSYGELDGLVNTCAVNLHEAGIGPGDVVGVMLPDSADHIAILYALAKLGAVSVSIDGRWVPREREQALAGLNICAVIAGSGSGRIEKETVLDVKNIVSRTVNAGAASKELNTNPLFDENQPLMVALSSGTTGAPKRLLWSHADVRRRGVVQATYLNLTSTDRYLLVPSITFLAARRRCFMMLCLGASVIINQARTSEQFLASLIEKKITFTFLNPALLQTLMVSSTAASSQLAPEVRIVVASAPMTHRQRLLARELITPSIFESYGTNEVGDIAFASPEDQDAYPNSVGRVAEGIEAQVVDESDTPLIVGEVGKVRFRGAGFPTSYLNDPTATAQTFRDGWFYPGDLAALNDQGYLFFKGRADDVINNEGAKFYPIEVENALLAHPAVAEAAVFGWPHERFGEAAIAFVVARSPLNAKGLAAFCRQRISGYKIPQRIIFVSELPRNSMGKIVKRQLKEQLQKKLAQRVRPALEP